MNRTDGLVRRNKARNTENGTSEGNSSKANSVDENDVILDDPDNEIDDTDSKETRLTLMEEVLLLGLKDKEVRSIMSTIDKLNQFRVHFYREFMNFFLNSFITSMKFIMFCGYICFGKPIIK